MKATLPEHKEDVTHAIAHFEDHHHEARMPFGKFFLYTGAQLAAAFGLFYWIAPDIFKAEFQMPLAMLGWVVVLGLPLSLFEYLYHRYLLHSAVFPFLGSMHRSHTHHHGLTNVKAPITAKEPDKMVPVDNKYAIEEEPQEESMMFPVYAISIFYALFMVLMGIPYKLLFPAQPIIAATLIVTTLGYGLYEFWHGIMHLPYDRFWKPALTHPIFGKRMRYVYSFHLMHHWRPSMNLAVVGFWGFAVWDHLFKTHHRPEHTPLVQSEVNYWDAGFFPPAWPIQVLDKIQAKLVRWSRSIEKKAGWKR